MFHVHRLCVYRKLITVRFKPVSEKEVNFKVLCKVKRKSDALKLTIKAVGYLMNCLAVCCGPSGHKFDLISNKVNYIDFGKVRIEILAEIYSIQL